MREELKPCPFCGSPSVTTQARHPSILPYFVECSTCDARGARREGREAAIAAWNHRPIEDKLQASIDALEWLREVEAYDPHAEHPLCTAAGNSSERGKMFARAEAEHEAILAAAREAVES